MVGVILRFIGGLAGRAAHAFTAAILVGVILMMLGSIASVIAGPYEDAGAAFNRGDNATGLQIYHTLADQGDAAAQAALGIIYATGRGVPINYTEAAKWLRLAANQGFALGEHGLALCYQEGRGVARNYTEAAKWERLAADKGLAIAQFQLGLMYAKGQGVAKSYGEAAKWYHLAAIQGDANAQYNLALLYYLGQGVTKNYTEAARWLRLTADQGAANAQYNLGLLYAKGEGVPQNFMRAYMWLSLSAAQGYQLAVKARETVAALMTSAQVVEAQKLAADWRPKDASASVPEVSPRYPTPGKRETTATTGTAFFVSSTGEAVTNAHVVEGCRQISMNGNPARLLARDVKNDLALLATNLHPPQWTKWRISVQQGEDIVAYGFPLTGLLSSGGNVVTGNVTALAGLGDDSRFLQISAPVQPGNSGGPLFDRQGNVVGVVVSKLNAINVASATGDIPQNVNFAIKASVAIAFLDAQHVAHSDGQGTGALSTPEIATRAQALAAQVICSR